VTTTLKDSTVHSGNFLKKKKNNKMFGRISSQYQPLKLCALVWNAGKRKSGISNGSRDPEPWMDVIVIASFDYWSKGVRFLMSVGRSL
jgi:hypothetical protein